jgi:preprotein translocase subunit YajC
MMNYMLAIGGGSGSMLPMLVIMGALFYFMIIRPQQKQKRDHQNMLSAVKTGDKIMTAGGIVGMVTNVKDDTVIVRIADNVKVELSRSHISRVIPKQTEGGNGETA